jgi:hypothetical protein
MYLHTRQIHRWVYYFCVKILFQFVTPGRSYPLPSSLLTAIGTDRKLHNEVDIYVGFTVWLLNLCKVILDTQSFVNAHVYSSTFLNQFLMHVLCCDSSIFINFDILHSRTCCSEYPNSKNEDLSLSLDRECTWSIICSALT